MVGPLALNQKIDVRFVKPEPYGVVITQPMTVDWACSCRIAFSWVLVSHILTYFFPFMVTKVLVARTLACEAERLGSIPNSHTILLGDAYVRVFEKVVVLLLVP